MTILKCLTVGVADASACSWESQLFSPHVKSTRITITLLHASLALCSTDCGCFARCLLSLFVSDAVLQSRWLEWASILSHLMLSDVQSCYGGAVYWTPCTLMQFNAIPRAQITLYNVKLFSTPVNTIQYSNIAVSHRRGLPWPRLQSSMVW